MNKAELIEAVAVRADLTKNDASKAVNAIFESVSDALAESDSVFIIGFGTFSISERAAKTGRNPRTGETIEIASSKTVKFKPDKTLKSDVND